MQFPSGVSDVRIDIALLLERWQGMVNLMAQLAAVPCVLINRLDEADICVQTASQQPEPAFVAGERIALPLNSYCSHVIATAEPLLVENASGSCFADNNPTFAAGFSYYYGLPLRWPDGQLFGTLCMLDRANAGQAAQHRALLTLFQQAIEYELDLLRQRQQLQRREQWQDQRFLQLFQQVSQSLQPTTPSRHRMLQSELFVLLTSQYQYWHQLLDAQLQQVSAQSLQSVKIAALVRIWSNLLAIAQHTEQQSVWPEQDETSTEAALDTGADTERASDAGIDVTPLLEQAVFKSALTLGYEVDLRSHLPHPLLLGGRTELWSLLGLALGSFLLIGASGARTTIFLSSRRVVVKTNAVHKREPHAGHESADHQLVLEWSLLVKEQRQPLHFTRDNQALYGFASVCSELAGARLEISASLPANLSESRAATPPLSGSAAPIFAPQALAAQAAAEQASAEQSRFLRLWLPATMSRRDLY